MFNNDAAVALSVWISWGCGQYLWLLTCIYRFSCKSSFLELWKQQQRCENLVSDISCSDFRSLTPSIRRLVVSLFMVNDMVGIDDVNFDDKWNENNKQRQHAITWIFHIINHSCWKFDLFIYPSVHNSFAVDRFYCTSRIIRPSDWKLVDSYELLADCCCCLPGTLISIASICHFKIYWIVARILARWCYTMRRTRQKQIHVVVFCTSLLLCHWFFLFLLLFRTSWCVKVLSSGEITNSRTESPFCAFLKYGDAHMSYTLYTVRENGRVITAKDVMPSVWNDGRFRSGRDSIMVKNLRFRRFFSALSHFF